jgi:hypothetical protein
MTRVLVRLVENEIGILVNKFLHGVLHKLVKRVELLAYKTLLLEETGNDGPAVLLGYLLILFLLILHAVVWVVVSSNKKVQDLISAKKIHNRYLDS